jgi:hypothetical protein
LYSSLFVPVARAKFCSNSEISLFTSSDACSDDDASSVCPYDAPPVPVNASVAASPRSSPQFASMLRRSVTSGKDPSASQIAAAIQSWPEDDDEEAEEEDVSLPRPSSGKNAAVVANRETKVFPLLVCVPVVLDDPSVVWGKADIKKLLRKCTLSRKKSFADDVVVAATKEVEVELDGAALKL